MEPPIRACDLNLRTYNRRFKLISHLEIDWNEQAEALLLLTNQSSAIPFFLESLEQVDDDFHYDFLIEESVYEGMSLRLLIDRELQLLDGTSLGQDLELELKVWPRTEARESVFEVELDTSLARHLERDAYWFVRFSYYMGADHERNRDFMDFPPGWKPRSDGNPFCGTIDSSHLVVTLKPGYTTNNQETLTEPLSFKAKLERPPQIFFPRGYRFVWPTLADKVPFYSVGHEALLVRIVRTKAADLPDFWKWFDKHNGATYGKSDAFRYFEATNPAKLERFHLNLFPFLKLKLGCLVLQVKSVPKKRKSDAGNRLIWKKLLAPDPVDQENEDGWDSTVFVIVTGKQLSVVRDARTHRQYAHDHDIPGSKPHLEPEISFPDIPRASKPKLRLYHLSERSDCLVGDNIGVSGWAWAQARPDEYPQKISALEIAHCQGACERTPLRNDCSFHTEVRIQEVRPGWASTLSFVFSHETWGCSALPLLPMAEKGPAPGCLTLNEGSDFWSGEYRVSGWFGFPRSSSFFELWAGTEEKTPDFLDFPDYFFGGDKPERPAELIVGEYYGHCQFASRRMGVDIESFEVELDFRKYRGRPIQLTLRSAVRKENSSERIGCQRVRTVHPADVYIGLKPDSLILRPGQDFQTEFVTVTPHGLLVDGHVLRLVGKNGSRAFETEQVHFPVSTFGESLLQVETVDSEGRLHRWEFTVYKLGAQTPQEFCLHLDRFKYSTEQTANVVFCTPYPGRAILQIGQGTAREIRRFELRAGEHYWSFEVLETYIPEATVKVDFLYLDEFGVPRHRELTRTLLAYSPTTILHLDVQLEGRSLECRVSDAEGLWLEETAALLWLRERERADRENELPPNPMQALYPSDPILMQSFHSWSEEKFWIEGSVFQEVRLRARKEALRKCTTYALPPLDDSRYLGKKRAWAALHRLFTDRDGFFSTTLELPERWGVYDVSLVVVSPTRASAVWTTPVAVGPLFWLFEPAPVLPRNARVTLSLFLEGLGDELLPVEVSLSGTGFRSEDTTIAEVLQPGMQLEIMFDVETEDVERAEFVCRIAAAGEGVTVERSSFLARASGLSQ